MKIRKTVLIAVIIALAGCAGPERRFNKLSADISAAGRRHDAADIARLGSSVKEAELSPGSLAGYSEKALDGLYKALSKTCLYLPDDEQGALRLEKVFEEKVRRASLGEDDAEYMFKAFTLAGLFDKAAGLRRRFPGKNLPEVPLVMTAAPARSGEWQAYDVTERGRKIELKALSKAGPRVVMVMYPDCEFAEMAAPAILADPEIGPAFRAYGFMLTRRFMPAEAEAFKDRFGFDALYLARKSSDFPGFDLLRISPTFYFVKDGEIIGKSAGWSSDDGGRASLGIIRKGLADMGVEFKK